MRRRFWLNPEIKDFYQFTPDEKLEVQAGEQIRIFRLQSDMNPGGRIRYQYGFVSAKNGETGYLNKQKRACLIVAVDNNWAIGSRTNC